MAVDVSSGGPASSDDATGVQGLGGASEPLISVRDLHKSFTRADGSLVPAIDGVSFDLFPRELMVLLGPSGCGKTTLLRAVAGLESPDRGSISIHSKTYYSSEKKINVPSERRGISIVFQSYALWPHMSAFENVAYPMRAKRMPKRQIKERVEEVLQLVGVPELKNQYPSQMSGGQQQRIAVARALVVDNAVVLFDEPLSNVDAKVRESLRQELLAMQRKLEFAALFVTHDQTEAMALGHRVAVMRRGQIQQMGSPRDVYSNPSSRYVSNFVGTTNELPGVIEKIDELGRLYVQTKIGEVVVNDVRGSPSVGGEVVLTFRPEHLHLTTDTPACSENSWQVEYQSTVYLGSESEHLVTAQGLPLRVRDHSDDTLEGVDQAWVSVSPKRIIAFEAGENGARA